MGTNAGNTTTPGDQRPQALRAVAARQAIANRFLAAAQSMPAPDDDPLAFPAFLSLKSIRIAHDGSLNLSLNIPAEYVNEIFVKLTAYCGHPAAVTMETINITETDPFHD